MVDWSEQLKRSFFNARENNKKIKYCVIEDTERKQFLFIDFLNDTDDGADIFTVNFGVIVAEIINNFLQGRKNAVYHEDMVKWWIGTKFCGISNEETLKRLIGKEEKLFSNFEQRIDRLIRIIKKRGTSEHEDKIALKCSYIKEWKEYRYMTLTKCWNDFIDLLDDTESNYSDDLDTQYFSSEEISSLVESNHNEAYEIGEIIHNITVKNYVLPNDIVFIPLNTGWVYGQSWFVESVYDMFSQDLYHVLVDNAAELPHICPRCGQLYYSNNNKSKYCDECKQHSNDIRKENRKKNNARYLHKRLWDKISASKRFDNDFLNEVISESNYYWDIVRKKEVAPNPAYRTDIKTEKQYEEWLLEKLEELKPHK